MANKPLTPKALENLRQAADACAVAATATRPSVVFVSSAHADRFACSPTAHVHFDAGPVCQCGKHRI